MGLLRKGKGQPFHPFSGYLDYPGQVPGRSTPLAMRTRIDPEIMASLEQMPPGVTLDRMLDRPVLRAQDAVSNLGLTKALESTISLRIQKAAGVAVNQLQFQKDINASMMESGLPADLQGVINARASRFYRSTLQKANRTETWTISELSEMRKASERYSNPQVRVAQSRNVIASYPKLKRPGKKKREKDLNMSKGDKRPGQFEETGGKFVMKVKKEGKTRYFYDEEKYKKEHGEHTSGDQARTRHIHDQVHKTVKDAGGPGADVSHFRDLVKKFGASPVHDSVRRHVKDGTVNFQAGKFYAGKEEKKSGENKMKKSFIVKGSK